MIRIKNFRKWQGHPITKALATRKGRIKAGDAPADSLDKPLALQSISIATSLDHDFARFADMVGGRQAETYLLRVLQYVGGSNALLGEAPVGSTRFGTVVLSRPWDVVSKEVGEHVYRSLISSGIAEAIDAPSCHSSRSATGSATRGASCGPPPDSSVPDSSYPPPPPRGRTTAGGCPPAASNGHGEPLTDTERIMANAVITCLAQHVGCDDAEQRFGFEMRKALRDNLAAPDDVREMIAKFGPRKGIRESVGLARNIARESA